MATKNIEPKLRLISEYLELGEKEIFQIPEYQRAYSWGTVQCDKLWQDIEAFIESGAEDPYFFGTIIIDCSHENQLNLIDGQQRTTTFLLILKALHLKIKNAQDIVDARGAVNRRVGCIAAAGELEQALGNINRFDKFVMQ